MRPLFYRGLLHTEDGGLLQDVGLATQCLRELPKDFGKIQKLGALLEGPSAGVSP